MLSPPLTGAAPDAAAGSEATRSGRGRDEAPGDASSTGEPPAAVDLEQERLELARAHDWFVEAPNGCGSHEVTRTRPLASADVSTMQVLSCQSGYGNAALDADALFMAAAREEFDGRPTIANFDTPPKRVLDVGCGVYGQWILAAAPTVGWEATRFVGLDLAPVLVPFSTLPHGLCARVQFVQHDFFQPLPFPDDAFDYIRCGGVAADIPEPRWDPLVKELKRCLVPGGTLEIALTSLRPTPAVPALREDYDAISEKQLLNVNLRALLPVTLAMNGMQRVIHVRGRVIPSPWFPPVRSVATAPEDTEVKSRVLLASMAHYTASHAAAMARVIAQGRTAYLPFAPPFSDKSAQPPPKSRPAPALTDQREVETLLRTGTAQMNKVASIRELMAGQWGWTNRVDEGMVAQLRDHLRAADTHVLETARAVSRLEVGTATPSAPAGAQADRREEVRIAGQRAEARRRDLSAQLQTVQTRLGGLREGVHPPVTGSLPSAANFVMTEDYRAEGWICFK